MDLIANNESGASVRAKLNVLIGNLNQATLPALSPATASFTVGAPSGTAIFTFGNLQDGEAITATSPNDGRIAISATTANSVTTTKAVVGLTASSTGTTSYTFTTSLGRKLIVAITVAAAGTALPQIASIAARWRADTLSALADGATVNSWTDSVGGLAAATPSGTAPTKVASALGGKPAVRFTGNGTLGVGSFAGSALESVTNSGTFTCLAVFTNIGANAPYQACPVGSFGGNNRLWPLASSVAVGSYNGGNDQYPYTPGNKLTTIAAGSCQAVNGTFSAQSSNYGAFSGVLTLGGISSTYNDAFFKGDLLEVIFWNRSLNAYEILQAQKALCDYYGQPYPWADKPFMLFAGDSLTAGYGSSGVKQPYPYHVANGLQREPGTYTTLAGVGYTTGAIETLLQNNGADGMPALVGGSPICVFGEWYNDARADSANVISNKITFMQKRHTAGWKNAFWTSIDFGSGTDQGSTPQQRADFNAYWDTAANRSGLVDYYAPVHKNANIGVAGAAPQSSGGNTYFVSDHIHLTGADGTAASGYRELAVGTNCILSAVSPAFA